MEILVNKIKSFISNKFFSPIIFLIVLFIGLKSFSDYGVYGDEPVHRYIGSVYFEYVKGFLLGSHKVEEAYKVIENLLNTEYLKNWVIWPVLFELPTESIFYFFKINDTKTIFEIRHLANFLIFYIALIFFYKILFIRFKSKYISIIGVLFLFFSPRIFADSFYNTKDILFLSLSIINIYTCLNFIKNQSFKNNIYFSLTSAILIDARLMGVLFPFLTISIILFDLLDKPKRIKKFVQSIIISLIIILVVTIFFWPFLWKDPINNFGIYLKFFSHPHQFYNLYFGEQISSLKLPWHYTFVWIAITIPISILLLSLIGFIMSSIRTSKRILEIDIDGNRLWNGKNELIDFFLLLTFIITIFSVLMYQTNFDGWRHLYFLYPIIIFLSLYGLHRVELLLKNKIFIRTIHSLIILNLLMIIMWNFKHHPYQYTYFNFIQKNIIKKSFDIDYFGLSIRPAIENILFKDKREKIKISSLGEIYLEGALVIFDKNTQKRFQIVGDLSTADYVINTHRKKFGVKQKSLDNNFLIFNEIIIDDRVVNTTYKRVKY